jgi:predicted nucleic acid-binding Zn ribbon protein
VPIYTYRCPEGHEWDEVRRVEGSEASEELCARCLEEVTDLDTGREVSAHGRKVPSQVSISLRGAGWTPKFYPDRKGK